MHTVELLAHALDVAQRLGYALRQDWLDGNGGGGCELRGRRYLFVDLATSAADQLEMVLGVLRREPRAAELPMPQRLRDVLRLRKSA
jgi:hypothetical protein